MADVSKIAANGIDYNIKDETARSSITTMQEDIDAVEADVATLQGDMTTAQGNISASQSDISALQTTVAELITSGSNYCRLSDGTLFQWGISTIPENTQYVAITFPIAFLNANYGFAPCGNYSYTPDVRLSVAAKATSGLSVYRQAAQSYAQLFSWIAIGRWK